MTDFEKLVSWATHEGWRYCQGRKDQCGNEMILKYDWFIDVVERIKKGEYFPVDYSEINMEDIEAVDNAKLFSINDIKSCFAPDRSFVGVQWLFDRMREKIKEESV